MANSPAAHPDATCPIIIVRVAHAALLPNGAETRTTTAATAAAAAGPTAKNSVVMRVA